MTCLINTKIISVQNKVVQDFMQLIQKLIPQCYILLEHCVLMSSSMRFFTVIHLTICFHEHKIRDHHRIQTQIAHREYVITFLANREKQNNMQIYTSYKQNITCLNITHVIPSLCRVTLHHNTTHLIHFHIIHVLKDQNTIWLHIYIHNTS